MEFTGSRPVCYAQCMDSADHLRTRSNHTGRRMRVRPARRLTTDLLWFNRSVPLCAHDRVFCLKELVRARAESSFRVSWSALFIRAFCLVAQRYPALRQSWYRWPISHLYQHPVNVATVTVHRDWEGDSWLFWGQLSEPESRSLPDIQQQLNVFRDTPVATVFRNQTRLAQLPTLLRRLIWWWMINVATVRRAKHLGTCFLSTLAGRGAEIQLPPSIHTGCLTFGPLNQDGECRVTLAYDHRVMDGVYVAEVLKSLESVLTEQLLKELREPCSAQPADEQAA